MGRFRWALKIRMKFRCIRLKQWVTWRFVKKSKVHHIVEEENANLVEFKKTFNNMMQSEGDIHSSIAKRSPEEKGNFRSMYIA